MKKMLPIFVWALSTITLGATDRTTLNGTLPMSHRIRQHKPTRRTIESKKYKKTNRGKNKPRGYYARLLAVRNVE